MKEHGRRQPLTLARSVRSRDGVGEATLHVTGRSRPQGLFSAASTAAAGPLVRGICRSHAGPQRLSQRPSSGGPTTDPSGLPIRWPWCPWRPPVAPGGSRCSCCSSVRVRPGAGVCGEGGLQEVWGLPGGAREHGKPAGRVSWRGGENYTESRGLQSPGAAGWARATGGPASRPRTLARSSRGVRLESAGRRLGSRIQLRRGGRGRFSAEGLFRPWATKLLFWDVKCITSWVT